MKMEMGNINLTMLIRQKLVLLRVMSTLNTKDEELLQGVLNLLDHIHDQVDPPKSINKR